MTDLIFTHEAPDGCTLSIRLHPGARRNAINGLHAGALKVSLTAPPIDDRANEALIDLLSDRLNIPKARITLIAGHTSRLKTLHITDLTAPQVESSLLSDEA
jgi:uncharacterized protein (TIGR00251 family)